MASQAKSHQDNLERGTSSTMVTTGFMITLVLGVVLRSQAHKMNSGGGGRGQGGDRLDLRPFYLWAALIALAASGTLAVNTIVGSAISGIASLAPWVGWCWAFVLIFGTVKDLWSDREPDKVAPWFLFLLPSVSNGLSGQFGRLLQQMWDAYGSWASHLIGNLFGA